MHTARSATFAALIALTIATPGWAQRGAEDALGEVTAAAVAGAEDEHGGHGMGWAAGIQFLQKLCAGRPVLPDR